jgi:uncharacterized protein (TIGR02466 family)
MQIFKEIGELRLFPTAVYTAELNSPEFLSEYVEYLQEQRTQGQGRENTNGNWCSDDCLNDDPRWQGLKELLLNTVKITLDDRGIIYKDVRMNCMWANIHASGSFHQQHNHPNCMYSGVIYLQVPTKDPGNFYFRDPRTAANNIVFDYKDDKDPHDYYSIVPKQGKILVFPNWLEHGTHAGDYGSEERISVSFNVTLECEMNSKHTVRAEYR